MGSEAIRGCRVGFAGCGNAKAGFESGDEPGRVALVDGLRFVGGNREVYPGRRRKADSPWAECLQPFRLKTQKCQNHEQICYLSA